MTNKKSTKRALLCSALSLLLCFSMLVGTTFAWFTDSVSSANNVIQSGNLDIELYYQNSATTNNWTDTGDNSWKKLDDNTNVFLSQLWEPGHTEVVKLKIVNEGSLDLKYQLGINVVSEVTSTNILGGELKLSNHIKFGVVEGDQSYNRENAVNAVASTATAINAGYAKASTLKAKNDENANDEAIITMVVYMPETVGNEANAAKDAAVPTINLGINLVATQKDAEIDSFGSNYDANATYPVVSYPAVLPEAGAVAQDTTLSASSKDESGNSVPGVAVTVPATAIETIMDELGNTVTSIAIAHSEPRADAAAKTITFDAIDIVDQNGNPIDLAAIGNDAEITVTLPAQEVFPAGETVVIYHDGVAVASATVNANGTLEYEVTHFCEVEISYADETIDSEYELVAALAKGGAYKLGADIVVTEAIVIPTASKVTLDLNGKTINTSFAKDSTTNHVYAFTNNGDLTIKNGTINARGIFNYGNMVLESGTINAIDGNGGYAVRNYAGATFTMNGGTIATILEDDNKVDKGGYDATAVRVDEGATFVMNGGTINNINDFTFAIDNYGKTIVNEGTITSVHTTVTNYGEIIINGGSFTCNGLEGITAHAVLASEGTTTINGGTFNGKDNYNGFNVYASEDAVVNIYGGNFLPVHSGSLYGNGTINVYGGTFFDDPSERVATGYIATKNADGTYTVVKGATVANAADLKDALAAGGNIVLTQDIALTDTLMINEDVVIDLNGNDITAPANGNMFHSGSDNEPSIIINSSIAGAEINISGGDTAVLLGYGSTEIKNVTINVTGCDNYSPSPFNVYGDLTIGEGTVVNVDYLGSALINNNGKVAISIDGAKFNIGTFKRNGVMIDLNNATTFEMKNTTMKINNYVLSQFGGEGLIKKIDGVTIENCTFDITDSNGASCTFVADAGLGRYDLVQK